MQSAQNVGSAAWPGEPLQHGPGPPAGHEGVHDRRGIPGQLTVGTGEGAGEPVEGFAPHAMPAAVRLLTAPTSLAKVGVWACRTHPTDARPGSTGDGGGDQHPNLAAGAAGSRVGPGSEVAGPADRPGRPPRDHLPVLLAAVAAVQRRDPRRGPAHRSRPRCRFGVPGSADPGSGDRYRTRRA